MNAQEQFWAGEFGFDYGLRNIGRVHRNRVLFGAILARCRDVKSVLELGAGFGENLVAIRSLLPNAELGAVEINEIACVALSNNPEISWAVCGSLTDWNPKGEMWDLVLTKGVLIHISPDDLANAYDTLFHASRRYVLVAEYYNPKPVDVEYRGHSGRLWKRDFAGEIMDRYPTLQLVDYGFVYHRDQFPQDDLTWFLMEKR